MIGGFVRTTRVEASADQIVSVLRDFTEPSQSARFEPHHQRIRSLLLQPLHAGCDAWTSPLAPLERPQQTTFGALRQRVNSVLIGSNGFLPKRGPIHLLATAAIEPEKIPD